MGLVCQR